MEEYRVDVKVRNNIILYKIEQAGYKSLGEFCRVHGIRKNYFNILSIINMKMSPLKRDGEFRGCIETISNLLDCAPLDLFSDVQLNTVLKTNKRSLKVNEAEMQFMLESKNDVKLLEEIVFDDQKEKAIEESLKCLTPRERQVIEMRMGLGKYERSYTLREIAQNIENIHHKGMPVNQARVGQIEAKALRKMRNPINHHKLKEFYTNE